MWTSWRAVRAIRSDSCRSSISPIPTHSSDAVVSAARIRSASGTPSMFASWAAFSARPSPPATSGWRIQSNGVAIAM